MINIIPVLDSSLLEQEEVSNTNTINYKYDIFELLKKTQNGYGFRQTGRTSIP